MLFGILDFKMKICCVPWTKCDHDDYGYTSFANNTFYCNYLDANIQKQFIFA